MLRPKTKFSSSSAKVKVSKEVSLFNEGGGGDRQTCKLVGYTRVFLLLLLVLKCIFLLFAFYGMVMSIHVHNVGLYVRIYLSSNASLK